MTQRIIEMLVGRLITDEEFRKVYLEAPEETLRALCDNGLELTPTEIAALVNTDSSLWTEVADAIDSRLQKVSLKEGTDGC